MKNIFTIISISCVLFSGCYKETFNKKNEHIKQERIIDFDIESNSEEGNSKENREKSEKITKKEIHPNYFGLTKEAYKNLFISKTSYKIQIPSDIDQETQNLFFKNRGEPIGEEIFFKRGAEYLDTQYYGKYGEYYVDTYTKTGQENCIFYGFTTCINFIKKGNEVLISDIDKKSFGIVEKTLPSKGFLFLTEEMGDGHTDSYSYQDERLFYSFEKETYMKRYYYFNKSHKTGKEEESIFYKDEEGNKIEEKNLDPFWRDIWNEIMP